MHFTSLVPFSIVFLLSVASAKDVDLKKRHNGEDHSRSKNNEYSVLMASKSDINYGPHKVTGQDAESLRDCLKSVNRHWPFNSEASCDNVTTGNQNTCLGYDAKVKSDFYSCIDSKGIILHEPRISVVNVAVATPTPSVAVPTPTPIVVVPTPTPSVTVSAPTSSATPSLTATAKSTENGASSVNKNQRFLFQSAITAFVTLFFL